MDIKSKNINTIISPELKTNYKNFPMVPRVIFGAGSFGQLGEILLPKRINSEAPFIFLVDDVFEGTGIISRIPLVFNDQIIFISADEEPKTAQVDALVQKIKNDYAHLPSGIIGIGGGTLLDLAKAVAIMLTNKGNAHQYQGWDLVRNPSVYHVGIPTISGTGAEVSRTTVLLGPEKKLGINSDYTTFDQVLMDPDLTKGVSKEQWFFTGMDCFIHCIESLSGTFLNAFSQSYGEKALELCKEVYLEDRQEDDARNKLMMASWHGGMSIAYSQVGVAHAMSYGLSYLLGVRHGIGNCLVFQHLKEFYPEGVELFDKMRERHNIQLPKGICSELTNDDFEIMINVALGLVPLWENALGKEWRTIITPEKLKSIYQKI
ncbi:iron-containing alcohol dehydrogenase family protein [Arenibacter sp. ARW7G5Y1]|uniref:iron-containing alcohol dehydrogenase family protein n=1 Tax=Arenibacter sp. ARW7G5Y1 TaxID=2135619 RepID=UPI000D81FBEA|nr:iron-containing alcohol dehydrogenase family protein [Arenibacter sp. ARW7G5Y1]PXX22659.1 3-deoxy-alpha-D-manno-octulosonate 8-oxidase [Arenibacter sp. ARW7G5Y1]|tara:strand:- start:16228 stop:17355 length:1128 start_codon:yes stop_codon:yes gene_type:complete